MAWCSLLTLYVCAPSASSRTCRNAVEWVLREGEQLKCASACAQLTVHFSFMVCIFKGFQGELLTLPR